jgi:hypothetical protein
LSTKKSYEQVATNNISVYKIIAPQKKGIIFIPGQVNCVSVPKLEQNYFNQLQKIRETGPYSSRNASKGAMISELNILLSLINGDFSKPNIRNLIINQNVLNKNTFENRRVIYNRLNYRYFSICPGWIVSNLVKAADAGIHSAEFLSLTYLYFAIRDRITHDFIISTIWQKWVSGITSIGPNDFMQFLSAAQDASPELKKWRETTRNKMASITLSALRDFGLLSGTAIKHIQRPTISLETTYHLLSILWAEGKRGIEILESPDWKLFLWNETDTTNALVRLAQLGWVKFERGGQTVILDLIRLPGGCDGE